MSFSTKILPPQKIYLDKKSFGYGVFAKSFIEKNEIIERCLTVKIKSSDLNDFDNETKISDYLFQSKFDKNLLFPFGYGGVYRRNDLHEETKDL